LEYSVAGIPHGIHAQKIGKMKKNQLMDEIIFLCPFMNTDDDVYLLVGGGLM